MLLQPVSQRYAVHPCIRQMMLDTREVPNTVREVSDQNNPALPANFFPWKFPAGCIQNAAHTLQTSIIHKHNQAFSAILIRKHQGMCAWHLCRLLHYLQQTPAMHRLHFHSSRCTTTSISHKHSSTRQEISPKAALLTHSRHCFY
jgi:hypothetical protein